MSTSTLVNATRQNDSTTANGAVTHSTSLNKCLDFFFLAGASRNMSESDIITSFMCAYNEDKHVAYKILFWARDCRGGAGEKRLFRVIAKHCSKEFAFEWDTVSPFITQYGSWKDVFLVEKPNKSGTGPLGAGANLDWLHCALEGDWGQDTARLCAKWFPRKGEWFVAMHKFLKMTPKEFRKYLVSKTDVVESKICSKDWSSIDYSKVPSVAMHRYRRTFSKHDGERFGSFIEAVLEGNTEIKSSTLFPYDLYLALQECDVNKDAVEAQWKALPDYMADSRERILPVCDVSGSMTASYGSSAKLTPMAVSVSLGLYIAERNKGIFQDAFLSFSTQPQMNYIKGDTLYNKMWSLQNSEWGFSTDLEATFDLVLESALRYSVPQDEMPTKLLVISDMEFDEATCGSGTNLDSIRQKYSESGYEMPEVIFWNVNGRLGNVPATYADSKVGLVSGCSPSILTSVLKGEVKTPIQLMLLVLENYNRVVADLY